ncbi:hypothetical protein BRARA_H01633 [Brassica rapa]|uniref:Uncharacterized protein n=1 Tax=Brassica campestris TaxID=3711 RepID=A0A397YC88_BRACM|nr:hypothetical protein BRARA_H01633 [Brassica rapa]
MHDDPESFVLRIYRKYALADAIVVVAANNAKRPLVLLTPKDIAASTTTNRTKGIGASELEVSQVRGVQHSDTAEYGEPVVDHEKVQREGWHDKEAPVAAQGYHRTCWTKASSGNISDARFHRGIDETRTRYSSTFLLDVVDHSKARMRLSTSFGEHSCYGYYTFRAMEYIMNNGIPKTSDWRTLHYLKGQPIIRTIAVFLPEFADIRDEHVRRRRLREILEMHVFTEESMRHKHVIPARMRLSTSFGEHSCYGYSTFRAMEYIMNNRIPKSSDWRFSRKCSDYVGRLPSEANRVHVLNDVDHEKVQREGCHDKEAPVAAQGYHRTCWTKASSGNISDARFHRGIDETRTRYSSTFLLVDVDHSKIRMRLSTSFGEHSCYGYSTFRAMEYIMNNGIPKSSDWKFSRKCSDYVGRRPSEANRVHVFNDVRCFKDVNRALHYLKGQPIIGTIAVFLPEFADIRDKIYRGPTSCTSTFADWHAVSIEKFYILDGEVIADCKNSHGRGHRVGGYFKASLDVLIGFSLVDDDDDGAESTPSSGSDDEHLIKNLLAQMTNI